MTRTARRSQRRYTLPATPWSILKRKFSSRYRTLEEENDPDSESASEAASCTSADTMDDSDSSADREATTTCSPAFVRGKLRRRKAPESDFKETRKTKLNGSAAKRFFQKIKQKFTARKLRRNLKKEEVAPLLVEDSCSGSDSGTATIDTGSKQKKSKRTKSKTSAKEKKFNPFSATDARPLLLEEGEESDDESSNCPNRVEGAGQGEEFDEICLDDDVGQIRTRKQQWNKESMEIEEVVSDKKRRQNEARRLRRQKTKVCFNCRQSGHVLSECTMPLASGTGICFKCGAATHTSKNCRAKVAEGQYPYAKCFICHEVGHLSNTCPDNPKGLYPHGGGCKVCGSVEHLKANCPERSHDRVKTWGSTSLVVTNQHSVDAEEFDMDTSPSTSSSVPIPSQASTSSYNKSTNGTAYQPRPKVVHF